MTLKITNRDNGREYSVDLTLAIKDKSWPEDAEEWKTRHRTALVKNLTGSLRIFRDLQGSLRILKDLMKILKEEDLSRILTGSLKDLKISCFLKFF